MDVQNPYAAPMAPVAETQVNATSRYFVVAPRKLVVMYIGTFGLYQIYWMYQQWAHFKRATKGSEWPVARSIFSLFFYHSLFREVAYSLSRRETGYSWRPELLASGIVAVLLFSSICGRLSEVDGMPAVLAFESFLTLPLLAYLHQRVQRAINAACGDADGEGNASFNAGNIFWLLLGALLWLLVGLGALIIIGVIPDA